MHPGCVSMLMCFMWAVIFQSCRDYLSRQGTNAESVWTQIISRVQQVKRHTSFIRIWWSHAGQGFISPVILSFQFYRVSSVCVFHPPPTVSEISSLPESVPPSASLNMPIQSYQPQTDAPLGTDPFKVISVLFAHCFDSVLQIFMIFSWVPTGMLLLRDCV